MTKLVTEAIRAECRNRGVRYIRLDTGLEEKVAREIYLSAGYKIVDILDYLEANYLTVTLQSTADHFGFHPNYLSAFIKRETGRTFKELVILQKMCQACFYLTNTDFPIYEIAQKVGYDNLGFFYRKFTELYHMTPQEFRERKAYT